MEIEFQKETLKSYMILPRNKRMEKGYQEKMAERIQMEGLLPFDIRYFNGEGKYYYEIQSRQQLTVLAECNAFKGDEIERLLLDLSYILKKMGDYLLITHYLLIDPEVIFVDPESFHACFCFYPENEKEESDTYLAFAEFLMHHINHEDEKAKKLAYGYYNEVAAGRYDPAQLIYDEKKACENTIDAIDSIVSIDLDDREDAEILEQQDRLQSPLMNDNKRYANKSCEENETERNYYIPTDITEKSEEKKHGIIPLIICTMIELCAVIVYVFLFINPQILEGIGLSQEYYLIAGAVLVVVFVMVMAGYIKIICYKRKKEEAEEEVYSDSLKPEIHMNEIDQMEYTMKKEEECGQTTILSEDYKTAERKVCIKGYINGTEYAFEINRNPYIIGKLQGKADGVIDVKGVSRVHAAIREEDGKYYLSDLNSTNGTRINGRYLQGKDTVLLKDGDHISLADTVFTFVDTYPVRC